MTSTSEAHRKLHQAEALRDARARAIAHIAAAGLPIDPIQVEMFTEADEAAITASRLLDSCLAEARRASDD